MSYYIGLLALPKWIICTAAKAGLASSGNASETMSYAEMMSTPILMIASSHLKKGLM